jgi:hypothetical protein
MTVNVTVAGSRTVRTTEVVATDEVRITGSSFDFEFQWMALEVGYFAAGTLKQSEMWVFSGQPLLDFMVKPSTGGSRYASLVDTIEDVVLVLQGTPGLKGTLIADGHLRITNGTLRSALR